MEAEREAIAHSPMIFDTLQHDPEKWTPVFRKDHAPPEC
jgi:hypothetical protein